MNIKELRQAQADLQREEAKLKVEGLALMNDSTEEAATRMNDIDARLVAISTEQADNLQAINRWESYQADRLDSPVASEGDDGRKVYAQAKDESCPLVFASMGEQLQAIYKAAQGNVDPRLHQLNQYAAAQGMGEAIGSDGGFLVQQDFAQEIFRKMTFDSQILSRVRRQGVAGNGLSMRTIKETSRATGSRFGAIQSYWVDEGTAPTASEMRFGRLNWSLKKIAALGYATDELMEDAPALGGLLTDAFAEDLQWEVENSVINGTGAGQPVGILNAAATVSQAAETGQAATTINSTNLSKMWSRLHPRSRGNAVWLVNVDVEPELDELAITVGTGGLNPRIVTYGPEGALRIKGREIVPVEYCATLGTVGDIILCDLSQYLLIDKGGIRQDTSMHVRFTTDEMAFRAVYRVDGQSLWEAALTPANGSNTLSPFVSLATRS